MSVGKKVLITGGYGMIGKALTQLLMNKGYTVSVLTRTPRDANGVKAYRWDVASGFVDPKALEVDCIIHLAGENIASSRWTDLRKKEILESRVNSTNLLYEAIKLQKNRPSMFIAASASGYYGAVTNDHIYSELDPAATDFLGNTCSKWEQSVDQIQVLGMRVVKLRTGVVLSANDGALAKMKVPVMLGIGSALGSGAQYFPWIHLDDLCAMYVYAIENSTVHGPYNAVAPASIDNRNFTKTLATVLHRPFFFPAVPAFALRLLFGEMAAVLLEGSRVSADKIQAAGFAFKYPLLTKALEDLLIKKNMR